MNACPILAADRPGHERPYRCRLPEGHALWHRFTDPPITETVGDRLAWDIAERNDE